MKRVVVAICLLAGMSASAFVGRTPALAAMISNQDFPTVGTDVNPCTGETFTYSGFFHVLTHATTTSDGSTHFGVDENSNVQGVDATGTRYVENGTESFTLIRQAGAPTPQVFEFPTTDEIISKGAAPNFYFHALTHITVNANGDVTASIDSISTSCQG
jgi:hypothetical protein